MTANVWDFRLDHPDRRRKDIQTSDLRRALVHDPQDGLTLNWAEDYPGGVTIQGKVNIPNTLIAGYLAGKSLTVSEGGSFGGGLYIKNNLVVNDEIQGHTKILLFSKDSLPFGQYSVWQLSPLMQKWGIDSKTIDLLVGNASSMPQFSLDIIQKYITLTEEKISVVSYNPVITNPVYGDARIPHGSVMVIHPNIISTIDFLRFNTKDNFVETPNLKVDGTIKAGPEQLDLVSEIKALKQQVAELKAKVGGGH